MSTKRISCLKISLLHSFTNLSLAKETSSENRERSCPTKEQTGTSFADHTTMQLVVYAIVTGVSLCPSPEASYYSELLFQMRI
jgi:hypothetical protein